MRETYCAVLGFWDEVPDDTGLNSTPHGEDDISLPCNVDKCHGNTELVGKETNGGEQVGEGHSFGTHLEGEDLDGVQSLEWGPANGVANLEDVDPCEHSLGDCGWDAIDIRIGGVVVDVCDGRRDGDSNPTRATREIDDDQHRATTKAVDLGSTEAGEDDLDGVHAQLDVDLKSLTADTGSIEELAEVVRDDTVASPLAKEGDDAVHEETITGGTISEQSTVVPPNLVGTFELQVRLVLHHLELDPLAVGVALAVVFGKDGLGLSNTAADVQPSGGFWEEPGEDDDKTGEHHLDPYWNEPGGVALVGKTTTSSTSSNKGTDGPEHVVQASGHTTMGGVRKLNDVSWTSGADDGNAETEEETATHELADVASSNAGTLDDNTNDDDQSSHEHATTTSPSINGGTDEWNSDNRSNLVHSSDNTFWLR